MATSVVLLRRPVDRSGIRVRPHAIVLGALLAAGVLVVDPDGWSPFGPAKWLAVTVVALVGSALAVGGRRLHLARWATAAWVVFLAWVVVAAGVGVDPRLAWVGTPQRHFGALTWMLCGLTFAAGHALDDDGDARLVVGAAVAVGGVAGLWSVAELCGWQPLALSGGDRLIGPMGSASYLGAAAVLLLPMAWGVAADPSWRRWWRMAAGCSGALGTVALVGSGARAAWVGAVAGAVALVVARRGNRPFGAEATGRPSDRKSPRISGVAGVGLLAGAGLLVGLAFATGTAGRVPAAFESGHPGGLSRLAEWDVAGRVLWEHPVTGVGPEGYRVVFGRAVDAGYQRRYGRSDLPDRAHDSLLDVAVTTGVPGVAAYVWLLVCVGRLVWRSMRRAPPWLAGVGVGLIAYTVGELLLFPLAELEPGVWMLAGLLCVRAVAQPETLEVRVPRATQVALVGAVGVALVAGVRSVAADRQIRVALADEAAGRTVAAERVAHNAVGWAPGNIVVRLNAADIDAAQNTEAGIYEAEGEVRAALAISPADPVLGDEGGALRVQLAQLTGTTIDWRSAQTTLSTLLEADPRNPAVLLQLGVVDAALGQDGAAVKQWSAAAYLAPGSSAPDADLAVLYQRLGEVSAARAAAHIALAREPGDPQATTVLRSLPASSTSDSVERGDHGVGEGTFESGT